MAKRLALPALLLATLAIALSYAAAFAPGGAPAWAPWPMALGVPLALVATMVLGAARNGRVGRLALPFAFSALVLAGGFAAALALPANEGPGSALWLGLPLRAAVIIYGIGLLPIVVLPIAYALTFGGQTLNAGDLERVRAAGEAWARAHAGPPATTPPAPVARPVVPVLPGASA
jgi:hypothetical protein